MPDVHSLERQVTMPSLVDAVIVLAACSSVLAGLVYPSGASREPLFTFGRSEKPTAGRLVAVALLSIGAGFGIYAMAQKNGWLPVLVLAPLFYFVLAFQVASNRFIQRFLVRPFLVYVGALAVLSVVVVAGPDLSQAMRTGTIRFYRGTQVSLGTDPISFWCSVFVHCLWIGVVVASGKAVFLYHRRGWSLTRYEPETKNRSQGSAAAPRQTAPPRSAANPATRTPRSRRHRR